MKPIKTSNIMTELAHCGKLFFYENAYKYALSKNN
jgi:hypothetical protein